MNNEMSIVTRLLTMTGPADCRSLTGIGGNRGSADHQQLPSSDLEMIGGVAAAANSHAPDMKHGGADDPSASDPAVYSLEEEDADLIVGAEILGPNAASPGMNAAANSQDSLCKRWARMYGKLVTFHWPLSNVPCMVLVKLLTLCLV